MSEEVHRGHSGKGWDWGDNVPMTMKLGIDPRFTQANQTRACWQSYVDYHRCINRKGESYGPCQYFMHKFNVWCPRAWIERWDDQRDQGIFPTRL